MQQRSRCHGVLPCCLLLVPSSVLWPSAIVPATASSGTLERSRPRRLSYLSSFFAGKPKAPGDLTNLLDIATDDDEEALDGLGAAAGTTVTRPLAAALFRGASDRIEDEEDMVDNAAHDHVGSISVPAAPAVKKKMQMGNISATDAASKHRTTKTRSVENANGKKAKAAVLVQRSRRGSHQTEHTDHKTRGKKISSSSSSKKKFDFDNDERTKWFLRHNPISNGALNLPPVKASAAIVVPVPVGHTNITAAKVHDDVSSVNMSALSPEARNLFANPKYPRHPNRRDGAAFLDTVTALFLCLLGTIFVLTAQMAIGDKDFRVAAVPFFVLCFFNLVFLDRLDKVVETPLATLDPPLSASAPEQCLELGGYLLFGSVVAGADVYLQCEIARRGFENGAAVAFASWLFSLLVQLWGAHWCWLVSWGKCNIFLQWRAGLFAGFCLCGLAVYGFLSVAGLGLYCMQKRYSKLYEHGDHDEADNLSLVSPRLPSHRTTPSVRDANQMTPRWPGHDE
ncbi:unnamed protein product [Amoebophrya sp. A120]|nr:unnamed protein product [Amoebophrya sp. A120]|eukprot:GSA120T00002345001.1